ncbi:MAG: hypothetical protein ABFD69_00265 [Candidatus Sumerlaeia bacterium]
MLETWGRVSAFVNKFTAMGLILALTVAAAQAQVSPPGTKVSADPSDVVRGRVNVRGSGKYFIGEPVVLRFTLSNHARSKLGIQTNFIPQSNLTIDIQAPGEGSRAYTGPFPPGRYPQIVFTLMPFDEFSEDVLVWSDPERPVGLAFDKPGEYIIQPSLMVEVIETKRVGKVPLEPIHIRVVDTPASLKPMIKRLAELKAFEKLQRRQVPDGSALEIEKMLKQYPVSSMTPYILYAIANHYTFVLSEHPERHKEAFGKSLAYYQLAAQSDSALKIPIFLDLLRFLDHEKRSTLATRIVQQLIKSLPPDIRGKIGGFEPIEKSKSGTYFPYLLKKYMINTPELDREKYWQVLN